MQSGYGAFDRKKFLLLGGYDDLFLPGRLEDSDLCFRAWKMGWKGYYVPDSIIYHKGAASFIKRFGKRTTLEIAHRNSFLFVWKNITDPVLLFEHAILLPARLILAALKGQWEFLSGFLKALKFLPIVIEKRKKETLVFAKKDKEVFNAI